MNVEVCLCTFAFVAIERVAFYLWSIHALEKLHISQSHWHWITFLWGSTQIFRFNIENRLVSNRTKFTKRNWKAHVFSCRSQLMFIHANCAQEWGKGLFFLMRLAFRYGLKFGNIHCECRKVIFLLFYRILIDSTKCHRRFRFWD